MKVKVVSVVPTFDWNTIDIVDIVRCVSRWTVARLAAGVSKSEWTWIRS